MLKLLNIKQTTKDEKIKTLINKAEHHSLLNYPTDPIDWSLPIAPPKWLSERQYIRMVSNLIYGELATVEACKLLQTQFGSGINYNFLNTQINDEEYHADIYKKYLNLLGHKEDPSEKWRVIIEGCLKKHSSSVELVIAFSILLEGEAVFLQKLIGDYMPCPLFAEINKKIRLDEARHVAFGKIILPHLSNSLSHGQKIKITRWAKELWFSSAQTLVTEYLDPSIGKSFMVNQLLNIRWKKQLKTLKKMGFS